MLPSFLPSQAFKEQRRGTTNIRVQQSNNYSPLKQILTGQTESIILGLEKLELETFTEPKKLVKNLHYEEQRQESLAGLRDDMIDAPIVDIINGFNKFPYCFTVQSCYGHFIHNNQKDPYNLEPLPITDTGDRVEYRIAYICLCIQNSALGRMLLKAMNEITAIDPQNIQLCCAEWFWKRQVNSYALQVEPDRFKHKDTTILAYREALHIEKIRNEFFVQLRELIRKQQRL